LKVALVHDWLTNFAGAERVVMALHKAYPQAPLYTSVYNPKQVPQFRNLTVHTSFLQKLPLAKTKHKLFPTLRARAVGGFNLGGYDVIISSASAEAKSINKPEQALHICYCHTPTRYYWSDYQQYYNRPGFGWLDPVIRLLMPSKIKKMRRLDYATAQKVDHFIANSHYVAQRIQKYYNREATVIYPPVEIERFKVNSGRRQGFLVVGRQVPYKRVDLAVQACSQLGLSLTVVGRGSENTKLRKLAGPTVTFIERADDAEIAKLYGQAQALIFTPEEDFGIVPVEAMACGTPVIAYGKGGATESVVAGKSGLFFDKQTVGSLVSALEKFKSLDFNPQTVATHSHKFSQERFIKEIQDFVRQKYAAHQRRTN
jgi:glycosyltransferase involved in cell wall biosynthesis